MKSLSIKPINCYQCPSCYESKIKHTKWDIGRVMAGLREYDDIRRNWLKKNPSPSGLEHHGIHGGEPLLLKYDDLHTLLRYNFSKFGRNGLQTNLIHLTDRHIDLFKRYKVNVGISLDGHKLEMNRGRFPDSMTAGDRKKMFAGIIKNVDRLINEKISISAIAILRQFNNKPQDILDFIAWCKSHKIEFVRFTPCIVYDKDRAIAEQAYDIDLFQAYKTIFDNLDRTIIIAPVSDIIDGMYGNIDNMTCSFKYCDPWSSTAEITLTGNGELGTCLHGGASLDGIQALRGDKPGLERYEILKQLPQKYNGCKDCKFWHMCAGGCPGAAVNNDWRNRTRFCVGLKKTFRYIYNKIKNQHPNVYLTPDFYPGMPDSGYIKKSTEKSMGKRQDRLPSPKRKNIKWKPIVLPGGILHQDSNSPEWLKLNPGWREK